MFRLRGGFGFAVALCCLMSVVSVAEGKYTTRGQDIVDRQTGEKVILRGFGLGCWLLPEGYMWGIRKLDRPWQFEKAIVDLIGEEDAAEFWRLYHENFVTEEDIAAMKSWGVNSLRIPLLASMLQPRDGQPSAPPFVYSKEGFSYLDRLVEWCEKYDVGVIWDLHGAPGGQNAENISDSDGEARLWTENEKYWPLCIDLWMQIVKRYAGGECIVGYDLLNEPLLKRYDGIDPGLLREFYVLLSAQIRKVDKEGIIFVEGDEWAQDFGILEPLDWDPHLVISFHSYPPTATSDGLERWDRLRKKYGIPLWHGETGEQRPPYVVNRQSTEFLEQANVGWSWWTHKKFDRMTQPWSCPRTEGFEKILAYWKGDGPRPGRDQAKAWLLEQAKLTNSTHCVFIPEMVKSLKGLDCSAYLKTQPTVKPRIIRSPVDVNAEEGGVAEFLAMASGGRLSYTWLRNGKPCEGEDSNRLRQAGLTVADDGSQFVLRVSNDKGSVDATLVRLTVGRYSGPDIRATVEAPKIDGRIDEVWEKSSRLNLDKVVLKRGSKQEKHSASFKALWDSAGLYLLVEVQDALKSDAGHSAYECDGVEVFLDCDNSKSDVYGDGDFRFSYVWHRAKVAVLNGRLRGEIEAAQMDNGDGYVMEFMLPWSALGTKRGESQFVGLDVHVNNNNGRGRILKRSWFASRDNAHLSPSRLGTVRLVGKGE